MSDKDRRPHHQQDPDKRLALSFGAAVADYERGRPGYPAEAVEWILAHVQHEPVETVRAVEIGAGTGKFTRALDATPVQVTAIEPIPEMRAQLALNMPTVTVREGYAESTGLPDDYADLAAFAQSWHWVDVESASTEMARILRPDGILALVWNVRDESVDWSAQLSEIIGFSVAERYDSLEPAVASPFERADYREFTWTTTLTREEMLAMVTSRSYIITMPDEEKSAMLARLDELLDTHPDLKGRPDFVVPYVTRVTIATPTA